jgi:peptidoglycan/xylan/chitin deacetylase (PgdA/CDA1 family)
MILLILLFIAIACVLVFLTIEYSFLIPPRKGLPVLMYHKVSADKSDRLTITAKNLESQFSFLQRKNYQPISFQDLKLFIEGGNQLPKKPVIITFDDAYQNNYDFALPLLKRFDFKATIFIPVALIGLSNEWDNGSERIMEAKTLRELAGSGLIEPGLHSYFHKNYDGLTIPEIENDLDLCKKTLESLEIPYFNILAYPYGGHFRNDNEMNHLLKAVLKKNGVKFALRIGNNINKLPIKDPYEMKRIDIRGTDKLFEFRIKLRKGRRKLFS